MQRIKMDGLPFFMQLLLVNDYFITLMFSSWLTYGVPFSGDEQTIELLVQNGSDINLKDNNGTTNLHSAVFLGEHLHFQFV